MSETMAQCRLIMSSALDGGDGDAAQLHTLVDDTNQHIRQQVLTHHTSLVSHTVGIEALQSSVDSIASHTATVRANVSRARQRTDTLYANLQVHTRQLARLHDVSTRVRAVGRLIVLVARLHAAIAIDDDTILSPRDLAKLAALAEEANEVVMDTDLSDIDVVAESLAQVPRLTSAIGRRASAMLGQAIRQGHEQHGVIAVTCLLRVDSLSVHVLHLLHSLADTLCLEFARVGNEDIAVSKSDPAATSTASRARLWTHVTRWAEGTLPQTFHAVRLLGKLLAENDEAKAAVYKAYHVSTEEVGDPLESTFWTLTTEQLATSVDDMRHIALQTLANEYPKLLRTCSDVLNTHMTPSMCAMVVSAWTPLLDAYMTQSRRRMQTALEGANVAQVEISNAVGHTHLASLVVASAADTITAFVDASLLKYHQDATQVIAPSSVAQKENVSVVNGMHELWTALSTVVPLDARVSSSRDAVASAITQCLVPLAQSATDACESILATVHDEDYGARFTPDRQCSLYMTELQTFVARLAVEHIAPLQCTEAVDAVCVRLGRRLIQLYMTHASLVRPVVEGGRLRLAVDAAQLELALEPLNLVKHEALKHDYECLRAMREALLLSPTAVLSSAHLGARLPFSLAIQLVISLSNDEHLLSPHASVEWSMSRYVQWLADHQKEMDRIKLLNGTLEAYTLRVQAVGQSEFAPEYPTLCLLLKEAVAKHQM